MAGIGRIYIRSQGSRLTLCDEQAPESVSGETLAKRRTEEAHFAEDKLPAKLERMSLKY
jgi:hypothetical protein